MRTGNIYYRQYLAGTLTETDDGEYIFQYDEKYVTDFPNQFVSFNFPVRKERYTANRLFAFFDGLIPEGWLVAINCT